MFSEKDFNIWESISDLMTGLMMIFLFISLAFLYELSTFDDMVKATNKRIYEDLKMEFTEEEMAEWGAEFDETTLAIVFDKKPEVLFDVNQSYLKPRFQEILSNFFPRYIKVLTLPENFEEIYEIRIEGYASIEYGENPDLDYVYFYNMQLSQDRARHVLQYVFGIPSMAEQKQWLRETIITNGYSFSGADKKIDVNQQRRIEFRVMTKSEHKLKENPVVQLLGKS